MWCNKRIFIINVFLGLVLLSAGNICSAAMGKKITEYNPSHKKSTLSITGEISTIQPTFIGIISNRDEAKKEDTEMLFIIDADVTYKSKELAELLEGDNVKITYENITEPDPDDPQKEIFVQRVTKEIHYLGPKSKTLKSTEP